MIEFRTSSFCSGGDCVEVGPLPRGAMAVRDTKDPGRTLVFTRDEWAEFVASVKDGEFDPR